MNAVCFLNSMLCSGNLLCCCGTQEGALSLELALATERGKWYEENRRAWQKQQRSLLSTAHREWSRAQEAVTKAELERARRRWEEKQGNVVQVRLVGERGAGEASGGTWCR